MYVYYLVFMYLANLLYLICGLQTCKLICDMQTGMTCNSQTDLLFTTSKFLG